MLHRFSAGVITSFVVVLLLRIAGLSSATLTTAQLLDWQDMPLFTLLSKPDPAAQEIIRQYLQTWSAKGAVARHQGIWIQSGMTKLAENRGEVPLPGASLTKIATTLASLEKWGPSHQFETLVSATGPIKNGVLQGDLVITGGGDPFFVWEEAIALGNSLNQLGIRRVTGSLVVNGDFYVNYQQHPALAGQILQQGLNSRSWTPRGFTFRYNLMPKGTPKPQVAIARGVKVASIATPKKYLLLRHRSISLAQILKEMNVHSNNEMAEMLTKSLGGTQVRNQLVAKSANVPLDEIQLVNGSGLGLENKISPRAVCILLMEVERFLQPYKLTIADVFPVSGPDKLGTMYGRHMPLGTTIKTGTLNNVSALAGVMPTRDRGLVWFAIMNRGGDVLEFRKQQDQLLTSLTQKWGISPTTYANTTQSPPLLGDPKRNEKISGIQTKV
ncbi:MAG TPA: D-alanyl-D-alanine carboxypeptidase [Oculatellaceae cyanobacterium]